MDKLSSGYVEDEINKMTKVLMDRYGRLILNAMSVVDKELALEIVKGDLDKLQENLEVVKIREVIENRLVLTSFKFKNSIIKIYEKTVTDTYKSTITDTYKSTIKIWYEIE